MKSRERSRKHYLTVVKPTMEKMKELAKVNQTNILTNPQENKNTEQ